jgi:hypothetical protein
VLPPGGKVIERILQGKTTCKGARSQWTKFGTIFTENFIARPFQPECLNVIFGKLAACRSDKASEIDRRVSALQAEVTKSVADCESASNVGSDVNLMKHWG